MDTSDNSLWLVVAAVWLVYRPNETAVFMPFLCEVVRKII